MLAWSRVWNLLVKSVTVSQMCRMVRNLNVMKLLFFLAPSRPKIK